MFQMCVRFFSRCWVVLMWLFNAFWRRFNSQRVFGMVIFWDFQLVASTQFTRARELTNSASHLAWLQRYNPCSAMWHAWQKVCTNFLVLINLKWCAIGKQLVIVGFLTTLQIQLWAKSQSFKKTRRFPIGLYPALVEVKILVPEKLPMKRPNWVCDAFVMPAPPLNI